MDRRIASFLASLLIIVASATPAGAQSAGGSIAGTVSGSAGQPLSGICVDAYGDNTFGTVSTLSDASGHYALEGLAPDSYRVYFYDCSSSGYVAEYYDNVTDYMAATLLPVNENATTGINAQLRSTGSISGTVTDEAGAPLSGMCVSAIGPSGGSTVTDATGAYNLPNLLSGDYIVYFEDCAASHYTAEYYDNQVDFGSANPVVVADNTATSGINAKLAEPPTALKTTDLTGTPDPTALAQALAGEGVSVSNATFTGSERAGGLFSGGAEPIGFEDGVILSSGQISNVRGPNSQDGITGSMNQPGDSDLGVLSGFGTHDAAVLEFDFVPNGSLVSFRYVFSSDEYNEFVNSSFNDSFGFFVNGKNCALVPDTTTPVTINTINNGNPYGNADSATNPQYYRNNDLSDGGGSIDTEMDGLTTVLSCSAPVRANQTNHMKLAIADASDSSLDSAVFLQRDSLTTCHEDGIAHLDNTPAQGAGSAVVHDQVEPAATRIAPAIGEAVHQINCAVVVPVEDTIDGALP